MSDVRFPFPNKAGAIHTLKRDYVFKKIPPEEIDGIIDRAWETGRAAAERFLKSKDGINCFDFVQVFRDEGIEIIEKEEDFVSGKLRYFSDFLPKRKLLTIYSHSVTFWAEANGLDYEDARNCILMHEFFHYLEYYHLGFVSRQYQVPMIRIGNFTLGKTGISALSEIAADAFAGHMFETMKLNLTSIPLPFPQDTGECL